VDGAIEVAGAALPHLGASELGLCEGNGNLQSLLVRERLNLVPDQLSDSWSILTCLDRLENVFPFGQSIAPCA